MRLEEFLFEGHVSCFRKHAFFFEDGHDSQRSFNQVQSCGQVHAEVHHAPLDSFLAVLFLFKDEHMMVEKLLQFLVRVVDAQLLECVEFKDFKSGNIQDTDEKVSRGVSRKSSVDCGDDPVEKSLENSFANGAKSVRNLRTGLSLRDEISANLDARVTQRLYKFSAGDSEHESGLFRCFSAIGFSLLFSLLVLEFHISRVHQTSCHLPDAGFLSRLKAENIKRAISCFEFLDIIDRLDFDFSH